jgi:hypothetical protein
MALQFPNNPTLNQVYTDTVSGFSFQWNGSAWLSYTPSTVSNIQVLDSIAGSFNGSTKTFALTVSSTAVTPVNAQQLIISIGGVIQNPGVDYTILNSNITFTTAPISGLTFFGELLGTSLSLNTLGANTVLPSNLSTGGPVWDSSGNLSVSGVLTATSFSNIRNAGDLTLTTVPFINNVPRVSSNYNITTAYNSMSIGPLTINSGVAVTVSLGAQWTII